MKYVNIESIQDLKEGDIIKHKAGEIAYAVVAHYGTRVTAVRIADVTNAIEWQVLKPVERGAGDDYPIIDLNK